ncbi:hypothetical protein H8959_004006 [Pygathrix nigripes]
MTHGRTVASPCPCMGPGEAQGPALAPDANLDAWGQIRPGHYAQRAKAGVSGPRPSGERRVSVPGTRPGAPCQEEELLLCSGLLRAASVPVSLASVRPQPASILSQPPSP